MLRLTPGGGNEGRNDARNEVCDMRFDLGRAFVRHIVTHDEYERLMKRRLL